MAHPKPSTGNLFGRKPALRKTKGKWWVRFDRNTDSVFYWQARAWADRQNDQPFVRACAGLPPA